MKYMINRAFGLRGVLTLLALMLAFAASAQNKITGKVVDENDQPAIGANVVVKGTTQGVSTDLKGMFAIPVKTGDVLVFSYLGYKSQEVKIAAQTRLDIKLVPEANIMDEVVVVGYGAVRRGDLTGSVASVSSKDVEGFKTGSVMEALGGQIAGVQITATAVLRVPVSTSRCAVWGRSTVTLRRSTSSTGSRSTTSTTSPTRTSSRSRCSRMPLRRPSTVRVRPTVW